MREIVSLSYSVAEISIKLILLLKRKESSVPHLFVFVGSHGLSMSYQGYQFPKTPMMQSHQTSSRERHRLSLFYFNRKLAVLLNSYPVVPGNA